MYEMYEFYRYLMIRCKDWREIVNIADIAVSIHKIGFAQGLQYNFREKTDNFISYRTESGNFMKSNNHNMNFQERKRLNFHIIKWQWNIMKT